MPRYYRSEKEFEEFEHGRMTQVWGTPDYAKFGRVLDDIATEVSRRNAESIVPTLSTWGELEQWAQENFSDARDLRAFEYITALTAGNFSRRFAGKTMVEMRKMLQDIGILSGPPSHVSQLGLE